MGHLEYDLLRQLFVDYSLDSCLGCCLSVPHGCVGISQCSAVTCVCAARKKKEASLRSVRHPRVRARLPTHTHCCFFRFAGNDDECRVALEVDLHKVVATSFLNDPANRTNQPDNQHTITRETKNRGKKSRIANSRSHAGSATKEQADPSKNNSTCLLYTSPSPRDRG